MSHSTDAEFFTGLFQDVVGYLQQVGFDVPM